MRRRFRVGTTSYIIPADLIPNVEFLGDKVDDVELILFEVEAGASNVPDDAVVERLGALAADHGLSYSVHLPLDIRLGEVDGPGHPSLVKAAAVIDQTRELEPSAYVLHLEGREVLDGSVARRDWLRRTLDALRMLGERAGGCRELAVENLEGYPPGFLDPVLDRIDVSCCVDVGHLWLDGHDPLPYLGERLHRTRIIHLHGIGSRDHQSLALMPASRVEELRRFLDGADYRGIVTLEVFNERDLATSLACLVGEPDSPPETDLDSF